LGPSDGALLRSLHRLTRDLSTTAAETPAPPFLRAVLASITRQPKLLAAAFDDLVLCTTATGDMPRSASLCLIGAPRAAALQGAGRRLRQDLATLLDLFPVVELPRT
jgi:hypothetical protein